MKPALLACCFMIACHLCFSQNVGIGTTTPAARLQVNHNTTNGVPGLLLKDSSQNGAGNTRFQNINRNKFIAQQGWSFSNYTSDAYLDVVSDSAFIGTFRGNGNVGFGNYSPTERVDVNGNINVTGTIKTNGTAGQPGQVLTTNSAGNLAWAYGAGRFANFFAFPAAGNQAWLVPAGITKIMIEAWGGGGAGTAGGALGQGSGGGGGGGYIVAIANVNPGDAIDITVGAGGPTAGQDGSASLVYVGSAIIRAFGGSSVTLSGGSFAVSNAATTVTSYDGLDGAAGTLAYRLIRQFPPSRTGAVDQDYLVTVYAGDGGDGGNTNDTGAKGGIAGGSLANYIEFTSAHNIRKAKKPGGGGGGVFNYTSAANSSAAGSDGKVIIHW